MTDRVVRAIITGSSAGAVAAFTETALAADKAGNSAAKSMEDSSVRQRAAFSKVQVGVVAVGAVLIGAGAVIVDLATKYQTSTNKMAANAGITVAAAQKIGTAFLATGGQTTFSAQQMMNAYAPIAGQLALVAGHALSAAEATKFMTAAMNLAEATGTSLDVTVASLAGVLQAYTIPVAGAAAATDLLTNVSHGLGMSVDTVAASVEKLHAKLGPLAPSLTDVGSLLLDVSSHGLVGSRALMLVNTGMNTLLGGSKATTAELKTLKTTIFDANGQFVGMASVISQLQPKLVAMTEQQRLHAEKALFGAGASKALDATLLAGLPGWEKAATAAQKTGTAHSAAEVATSGLNATFEKMKAAVENVGISLGQQLLPAITSVMQWVTGIMPGALRVVSAIFKDLGAMIGWVADHFNILGPIIGTVVAGFVAFKVALMITATIEGVTTAITMLRLGLAGATIMEAGAATGAYSLGVAFTAMLGPIGLVIAAVAVLTAGLIWVASHHPTPDQLTPAALQAGSRLPGGGAYGKGKASGGPVTAGTIYPVGEAGPEYFLPNINGTILPNGAGGGSTNITNNMVINVVSNDGKAVVNALRQWQASNGTVPISVNAARRLGPA